MNFPTVLVTIVAIAGLVVLIALHDVNAATGVAIIAGLAGAHVGAGASNSAVSTATQAAPVPNAPRPRT